jgi:hypothetical protein
MTEPSRLAALVDDAVLDAEAARALWTEFSAHMDENKGDMAGFARKKGWQSVAPEFRQGKAVLVVQTGAAVKPRVKPASKGAPGPSKGRRGGKPRP